MHLVARGLDVGEYPTRTVLANSLQPERLPIVLLRRIDRIALRIFLNARDLVHAGVRTRWPRQRATA